MTLQMLPPKNGLFLTPADAEEFGNAFGKLLDMTNSDKSAAAACGGCSTGCGGVGSMATKTVTFVVTEKCNLDCTYCYETHKTDSRMTKEVGKAGVDFIFDEAKLNGYYEVGSQQAIVLDFIGGEPLLEIELMDYIVDYFKFKAFQMNHPWAYNYMISISSNGTLFDSPKVQRFLEKNPNKVSLSISVDGNKELHDSCRVFHNGKGSYDLVARSMKRLIEKQGHATTKMTLAPENIHYLFDAAQNLYHNLGLRVVSTNCVYEEGWKWEHAQIYYDQMKQIADWVLENDLEDKFLMTIFDDTIGIKRLEDRNYCGGNGEMLAISTKGKVSTCIRFFKYALSEQPEQIIGDVWNGIVERQSHPWLSHLSNLTMTSQSRDKCNNCQISQGCGLCTAYNYDKFGDPNIRAHYTCGMHHARVTANAYYWNKVYKKHGINKEFVLNVPNYFEKEEKVGG